MWFQVPEILTVGNKRNRDTLWLSGMCLSPGAAGSVLPDRWYRVERPSGKPDTLKGAHRSSPVRCPPFRVSAPSLYRYAGYGFASVCEPRREQTMSAGQTAEPKDFPGVNISPASGILRPRKFIRKTTLSIALCGDENASNLFKEKV